MRLEKRGFISAQRVVDSVMQQVQPLWHGAAGAGSCAAKGWTMKWCATPATQRDTELERARELWRKRFNAACRYQGKSPTAALHGVAGLAVWRGIAGFARGSIPAFDESDDAG
jgi:ribosomal protein L20